MYSPLTGDVERLVEQRDVGGALELVAPVRGHLELHPVAVPQRELAALVFVAEWHLPTRHTVSAHSQLNTIINITLPS